jgi:hypothetical protein
MIFPGHLLGFPTVRPWRASCSPRLWTKPNSDLTLGRNSRGVAPICGRSARRSTLLLGAHFVLWSLGLAGGPLLLPGIPGCPGLPPVAGPVDGFTFVPAAGPLVFSPDSAGTAASGLFVCAIFVEPAGLFEFPIWPAKAGEPRIKAAVSIWRSFVMLNSINMPYTS